jgi:ABC-type phosphate transport system substrate-binding protein
MMKFRQILSCLVVACALPSIALADGGVVVIVNKANDSAIDKALVSKIYRGETRTWPSGGAIAAFDLSEDNLLRDDFDSSIVGKSEASLKTLWAQNVFSGKATPPKVVGNDAEVKKAVASNKGAIGYILSSSVDDTVKVVLH